MAGKPKYPNAEIHDRLRRSAENLIDKGVELPNHGGSLSVDALQLLYQKANTPDSAADALKLLHELQTYQVELDLLYEQLQSNEQEMTEELAHYRSLYEQAPVAYLIVANDGEIIESNQAAGVFFGVPSTALIGRAMASLLASGQENTLSTLIRQSREQSQDAVTGSVTLPDQRCLTINTRSAADGNSVQMVLTETSESSVLSASS
ncbi:MAG: PAS domain S-box protein [Pseudomonadota bacterium]